MKICFIGLGSIGCRHLKNISEILTERKIPFEIHALRSTQKPLSSEIEELLTKTVTNYDALDAQYDIVFITNPTDKHYETLQKILPKAKNIFIEKPLFMNTDENLGTLPLQLDAVYYVAAPLRYNPVFPIIEQIVKEHRIFSARAICSSYLPEWRKNIDYRKNYSAVKEMGGGVSLDLIHEWDYLKHLFGIPEKVCHLRGTKSDLEITSDDISVYIAEYQDKIVELHLDYFGRRAVRTLELYTKEGTFTADFNAGKVSFDNGKEIKEIPVLEETDSYIREMNYFLNLCLNKEAVNQNDIKNAFETLKLTYGEI